MYPTYWDMHDGQPINRASSESTTHGTHSGPTVRLSVGAAADSAHEYTLKQFLLTACSDRVNLEMC